MPAERLKMRRVREILRHRFEDGLGHKSIALRVGAAPSTVRETLRRVENTRQCRAMALRKTEKDVVTDAA
jgi:hypothetical protein